MTGFEPLIAAATAGLTGLVTEIIKEQGGNAFTQLFSRDIGKDLQQAIFNALEKYIQSYTARHGIIKVLRMSEPVSLESIYTNVQVLDEEGVKRFCSIQDLEKDFRSTQTHRLYRNSGQKIDGIEVINKNQYLMLLGSPGSGKSTFIRKIGLEALKGKKGGLKHQVIPVFLELKRLTETKVDLKEIIANEFDTCGLPSAKSFTQKALEQGRLLILLDGLDEVPTNNLNQVIETIQDFVDKYNKNYYIASCRIAAYRNNFRRFTDVIIAEFDDQQIKQFINNWFQSEEDKKLKTAQKCWELLKKPENIAAKELAHTPLLLTFLCLVYDRSQMVLNNRSALYHEALRILIKEWAAEQRIRQQEIYQGLNTELEEVLLSEIAYKSFEIDRLFIPQTEIVQQIKAFLSSNLNAPKHLSGEEILDAIAIQQGILVERAEAIYSFSHLTLQEYLTAKYIADNRHAKNLVKKYLTDRRWREVFLLISGLMVVGSGADELLLEMSQVISKDINSPKLIEWFSLVDQISGDIAMNLNPIAKRALAMSILITPIGNEITSDSGMFISNIVQDIIGTEFTYIMEKNGSGFITIGGLRTFIDDDDFNVTTGKSIRFSDSGNSVTFKITQDGTVTIIPVGNILYTETEDCSDIILGEASSLINDGFYIITNDVKATNSILNKYTRLFLSEYMGSKLKSVDIAKIKIADLNDVNISTDIQYQTYKFNREYLLLSLEEAKILEQYFYATLLLIQCKQAAGKVSPDVWNTIEDKLLRL